MDEHKFPLKPIVAPCNEFRTNRNLPHMFPFLDVTLVVAQDVIEKILIAKSGRFLVAERD